MYVLTDQAKIVCGHQQGEVTLIPTQRWVTIEGHSILVQGDLDNRLITGCPVQTSQTSKPCTTTLPPTSPQGYSTLLKVEGKPVCLKALVGFTDGMPGPVPYTVRECGQDFVSEGL
jgi:hypothetical protein